MSNEVIFVDGLLAKPPHQKAPDFVKCALSIKREDLIAWLQGQGGDWINLDVKEGRSGKWYASVNDFKPKQGANDYQRQSRPPVQGCPQPEPSFDDDMDSIPF